MTENGTKHDFDLLVIGAGSGGTRAARCAPEFAPLAPSAKQPCTHACSARSLWLYALTAHHLQNVHAAGTSLNATKPQCMVATPESAYLSHPRCSDSAYTARGDHCTQLMNHMMRNPSTKTVFAGAHHPTAACRSVDHPRVSPYNCRFAAQNYGAKVGIVELPFAFIPDDKHGGAGGTCVAQCTCMSKLRRPHAVPSLQQDVHVMRR